jgi:hypothetical protein
MGFKTSSVGLLFVFIILSIFASPASANRLEVQSDAHWFFHLGALALLYLHIAGGAIGIVSGVLASLTVKGSKSHRIAGKVFFWGMLICYLIGALVAPFLDSQQSTNFVAAILALYLLVSGVSAARRRNFTAQTSEKIGLLVATAITLLGAVFMYLSSQSPNGSVDGSPPQAYILFVVAGGLAVLGELQVIYKKRLSNTARIARHLWRMCTSFFIASGSLFFGQAQFFPDWFNESLLPLMLGFFPFLIMLIYLVKSSAQALKATRF